MKKALAEGRECVSPLKHIQHEGRAGELRPVKYDVGQAEVMPRLLKKGRRSFGAALLQARWDPMP